MTVCRTRSALVTVLAFSPWLTSGAAPAGAPRAARTDALGDPLPPGAVARFGTTRLRHGKEVQFLAFTPDGRGLASLADDGTARLWDTTTGRELRRFRLAAADLACLAFSADGKMLAVADGDKQVGVWQTATGKALFRWPEGEKKEKADVAAAGVPAALPPPVPVGKAGGSPTAALAFSPDGIFLAAADDESVRLYDLTSGKPFRRLRKPKGSAPVLAFSPDGRLVACGGGDDDPHVRCWDTGSGKKVRTYEGNVKGILALAFSPDGKLLATADADGLVRLWETASEEEVRQVKAETPLVALRFAADGKTLTGLGGTGGIFTWAVADGKEVRRTGMKEDGPQYLALAPDGKTVAAHAGGVIRLVDVASGKERPAAPHQAPPRRLTWGPRGKVIAAGSGAGPAVLWDAATGRQGRRLGHQAAAVGVAFSPDGRLLAVEEQGGAVCLWDSATGKELGQFAGDTGAAGVLTFSPDGKSLVSAGGDHALRLWRVASLKERHSFTGHEEAILAVAFTADGRSLVSAGIDHTVRTWEVLTGGERRRFRVRASATAFAFAPAAGLAAVGDEHGSLSLHRLADGKVLRRLAEHAGPVLCVAFSPDGKLLASGGDDDTVRLWDVATGDEVRTLTGHDGDVVAVAFSPDGKRLASGSDDGTALVWDLTAPRPRPPAVGRKLDDLWADLASHDAARADAAVRALTARPEAVPYLRTRLRPVAAVDPRRLSRLLADLDGETFRARQQAAAELEALGELAEPALRKALASGPTLELRKNAEALVEKLEDARPTSDQLRALRAVEALEHMGTVEARRVLAALARGAPGARLTRDARAAVRRMPLR